MADPLLNKTETDQKLISPDYSSARQSGDFRLREVSIHSKSNPNVIHLNSAGVFVSLDIFEDCLLYTSDAADE